MKRALSIAIAAVVLVSMGFAAGYWYSDRHPRMQGEMEAYALANILSQLGYAGYLLKSDLINLRELIDIKLNGDLSRVLRYEGSVTDDSFVASKIRTLNAVANLWEVSPPSAATEQDISIDMRQDWLDMRAKNRELLEWARQQCRKDPSLGCATPNRAFESGPPSAAAQR
jgi:hypothetical protein